MFFLLSGEGPTDLGADRGSASLCEGDNFQVGPMAELVAKIVEARFHYSILPGACGFISLHALTERAKLEALKAKPRRVRLPGLKQPKETGYYYKNARILAQFANKIACDRQVEVVAVLFRDADGTASGGRGIWQDKWNSMLAGFAEEQFHRGVPMIPKPKSEAWLICAWKNSPYQGCDALERKPGNDNSPNNLKQQLAQLLNTPVTPDFLRDKIAESFEIDRITMPSFQQFRNRLEEVLRLNSRPTRAPHE